MGPYGRIVALATALAALAGCGGGGGGASVAEPPGAAPRSVRVKVIDGAIGNALVCLDRNRNDGCDEGEPSARTAADGSATLELPGAEAGRAPMLALVGTDAVDAAHGRVETAFKLRAPVDRPDIVSPLTTLVQQRMAVTGQDSARAEAQVREQLNLQTSLFSDYTEAGAAEGTRLATVARLVVLSAQVQARALQGAVGGRAIDGAVITAADLERAIWQRLWQSLPAVASASADARLQAGATPRERRRAMTGVATELAASVGLTEASLAAGVGISRQPEQVRAGGAAASLVALSFASPSAWSRHLLTSSVRQNEPDREGAVRQLERRSRSVSGVVAHWGWGATPSRQSDLHWNGKDWVGCALDQPGLVGEPDASGLASYDSCDGRRQGMEQRASFDVSGRRLLDVYREVRDAGFDNLSIAQAAETLGTSVFPAGSRLTYSLRTPTHGAPTVSRALSAILARYPAAVLRGDGGACEFPSEPDGIAAIKDFADMLRHYHGKPCVAEPDAGSGPRNERWDLSTVHVAQVGAQPLQEAGGYYTTNQMLRAAFAEDRKVNYYRCAQRARDGAAMNCELEGTGHYELSALGGARLMTLSGQPILFASQPVERLVVAYEGAVRLAFRDRLQVQRSAQLNLPALNALQAVLGLPAVDPERGIALTEASYDGVWSFGPGSRPGLGLAGTPAHHHLWLASGSGYCSAGTDDTFRPCRVSLDAATGAFTFESELGAGAGVLKFAEASGTLRFTDRGGAAVDLAGGRR